MTTISQRHRQTEMQYQLCVASQSKHAITITSGQTIHAPQLYLINIH